MVTTTAPTYFGYIAAAGVTDLSDHKKVNFFKKNNFSFYVIRRRKIHFPQMSETAILQQEPAMPSEVKLSETETICMLDKKRNHLHARHRNHLHA
jgi:hypothetical protein